MTEPQTLIVGDIQGCYGGLMALLEKANFDEKRDRLVAVGDLVARGEDSLSTLRYLMDLGPRFSTVLGNHDLHFLAVSQGIKSEKKSDKLTSLLKHKRLADFVDWLRQFPLALALDEHTTLVHAGLYPLWSPAQLRAYSEEVGIRLQSPDWRSLLKDMYGNGPNVWKPTLAGEARSRFIINACTRMRFIEQGSKLEFATKSDPGHAPASLAPWFAVTNPHIQEHEKIIFGHWAALNGLSNHTHFVGLDTGYVWGNTLTALHFESNSLISIKA